MMVIPQKIFGSKSGDFDIKMNADCENDMTTC
jgi:hypothetical protein